MNAVVIFGVMLFGAVLYVVIVSQHGRLKVLNKRLKFTSQGVVLVGLSSQAESAYVPRRFEVLIFAVLAVCSLGVAFYLGSYLFLCVLYGVSRVRSEHLHFLQMPKGYPWVVSNGDKVQNSLKPLHYAISVIIWVFLTAVGFVLIRRLLPEGKTPSAYSDHD